MLTDGGKGPNKKNLQWTLDFACDFGGYQNPPGSGKFRCDLNTNQNRLSYGPILRTAMDLFLCPNVVDPLSQDQTFDLNYADPATVLKDPTNPGNTGPGSLIMIYEGTNRCIGLPGGSNLSIKLKNGKTVKNNFYATTGVATSNDYGHTWPSYRYDLAGC